MDTCDLCWHRKHNLTPTYSSPGQPIIIIFIDSHLSNVNLAMLGIHLLLAVIAWESQDQLIPPLYPDASTLL